MVAALKPFNSVWSFEIIELRQSGSGKVAVRTAVVVLIITKKVNTRLSSVAASILILLVIFSY